MQAVYAVLIFTISLNANAWGKRGHQVVAETAAMVVASEPEAGFMKTHSFDFGYMSNIPDLVWKRPANYELESKNHFMDLEIFDRGLAKAEKPIHQHYALSREEFDKKFPEIPLKAGRAFWRVREMVTALETVTERIRTLQKTATEGEAKTRAADQKKLQEKWLLLAGTLSHYIGDLAQPLHVTENYDGEMTSQKGIHHFFEESCVDEIYPQIGVDVLKEAKKQWPKFTKANAGKSTLELLIDEAELSAKELPNLLAIDRKQSRKDLAKAAEKFRPLIARRLVSGSLYMAEIYRRNLGWNFNDEKFYFFPSEPAHIPPGPIKIDQLKGNI